MPLYLEAPKPGRSPNHRVRGTHLGTKVDKTSGTPRESVALKIMRAIEEKIERGEYAPKSHELDFVMATNSYLEAGGENRFTEQLADHFAETPLSQITQAMIDAAAVALYPDASPATRNRQVYTPVSAVLVHAGVMLRIVRPKGAQGKRRLAWLTPEEATRLIASATAVPRFGALLAFLFGTGCRLGEGLALQGRDLDLPNGIAFIADSKNGEPRAAHLPPNLVAMLANTEGLGEGCNLVFGWRSDTQPRELLNRAAHAAGVDIPDGIAFHITCHSWATWMRRYGGADTRALVATGRWKSASAAGVYEHTDSREESRRADLIPLMLPRAKGV